MRKVLIPVLFVLAIPISVDAFWFKDKPLTYDQIAKNAQVENQNGSNIIK